MLDTGSRLWQGFGNELTPGGSLADWIVEAGLNFQICSSPVQYTADGILRDVAERRILWRSDTGEWLGDVGREYKIVQPVEILSFFRDLARAAGFELRMAGKLFGGRRVWALAYTGLSDIVISPKDKVENYLLLSTSCDGTMTTEGRYVVLLTVNESTLPLVQTSVKVPHRTKFNAASVKSQLDVANAQENFNASVSGLRQLAEKKLPPYRVEQLTSLLFHEGFNSLSVEEQRAVLSTKPVRSILELALHGTARGANLSGRAREQITAWGWLASVTEYIDHYARAHNTLKASAEENRFDSSFFGRGSGTKDRAYQLALKA